MRILFIHQNMPGQFEHMARHLAKSPANDVWFITCRDDREIEGVKRIVYPRPPRDNFPEGAEPPNLTVHQQYIRHGLTVGRICVDLKNKGVRPDIIVAHPGWGEALFVKDVFGDVPLLNYCEFYYRAFGSDRDFYPGEGNTWTGVFNTRIANTHLLHSITSCDFGLSPTQWQKSQHPQAMQDKIAVIHDGIDTHSFRPHPQPQFELPNGRVLTAQDEVVTYGVRNLERYRGFDMFMRAVPEICARNPNAQVVIAGGDDVSYGQAPKDGLNWRQYMLKEVEVDPARVHFVGFLPLPQLVSLLQLSTAHVYLTMPFVLSWSMMMAMSTGCLVVASSTAPVKEVLRHEDNGLLFDYFKPAELAQQVSTALSNRRELWLVRQRARQTILDHYSLDHCLPRQLDLLTRITSGLARAAA